MEKIDPSGGNDFTYWIEGIGDVRGIIFPYYCRFETDFWLTCYEEGQDRWSNNIITGHPYFCGDNVGMNDETEIESFQISPNPAYSHVIISWDDTAPIHPQTEIRLFDIRGRLISEHKIPIEGSSIRLEVESIANGVYFIQFATGSTNYPSMKLMVSH